MKINVYLIKMAGYLFAILMPVMVCQNVEATFPGYEKILSKDILQQTRAISTDYAEVIVTLHQKQRSQSSIQGGQYAILNPIEIQRQVISRLSGKTARIGSQLNNLPVFSASVTGQGLKELASMGEVMTIEKNWSMELHTLQGIPLMNPGNYRSSSGGKGVAIAIVDSGLNYDHPAFGRGFPNDKVIGGYDFGENDTDPMEGIETKPNGTITASVHGTNCAGIAAGNPAGDPGYAGGVAPQSKLYALKVANSKGGIDMMNVLKSWDWCITHQNDDPENPIMIISCSIGMPRFQASSYCDDRMPAFSQVAEKAAAKGIAIFVSSGNDSMQNSIACPSCLKDTISVGAVFDDTILGIKTMATGPDVVTAYSNTSEILDLLAPSHNAYVPSSPQGIYNPIFGGTSAACPYAAGAAALIQSHHKKTFGEFLSVKALRAAMTENGDMILDNKSGISKPRVNITRSIETQTGNPRQAEASSSYNNVVSPMETNTFNIPGKTMNHDTTSKTVVDY